MAPAVQEKAPSVAIWPSGCNGTFWTVGPCTGCSRMSSGETGYQISDEEVKLVEQLAENLNVEFEVAGAGSLVNVLLDGA